MSVCLDLKAMTVSPHALRCTCPLLQGETVRSRAAIIRVKDNAVDYLLTNLALRVTIPLGCAAKAPAIRGPFEENVMPNELLTCAGSRNASMVLVGGMDTG